MEKENASKGKAKQINKNNSYNMLFIYFNISRDKVC